MSSVPAHFGFPSNKRNSPSVYVHISTSNQRRPLHQMPDSFSPDILYQSCSASSRNPIIVTGKTYFYSHYCSSKAPVRQSLYKSDVAGRIIRLAIKLSEYDIEYTTRKRIKANTLLDFVVECTDSVPTTPLVPPESSIPYDCWKIHVDGSAAKANRGADNHLSRRLQVILRLKYTFPISNNEFEYEAVLAGLRVARTLHIQKLQIFTDSQVIASHINSEFKAKEDNM